MSLGDSIERVTERDKLRGIRGWLLLPALIAVTIVLRTMIVAVFLIIDPSKIDVPVLSFVALNVSLGMLGAFALLQLMREKKIARLLMIVFFGLIACAFAAISFVNPVAATPQFLAAAAIVVYFLVSKRVKVTLVN